MRFDTVALFIIRIFQNFRNKYRIPIFLRPTCRVVQINGFAEKVLPLTRAPLGYFYNAPHWGGAISSPPPLISETTGPLVKIQTALESPGKNFRGKTNCIDLRVTSDVTGQVKVKMFDFSGLVTSVSKIAMLSSNKANESAWIVSLTFVSIFYCAL